MSPENTMAPPTSQKRIDANRRNAQKSSGPRTAEGKSRSRFNRLEHGLAAPVPVLPGEDPAAFQARVDAVVESFAPQNQMGLNTQSARPSRALGAGLPTPPWARPKVSKICQLSVVRCTGSNPGHARALLRGAALSTRPWA